MTFAYLIIWLMNERFIFFSHCALFFFPGTASLSLCIVYLPLRMVSISWSLLLPYSCFQDRFEYCIPYEAFLPQNNEKHLLFHCSFLSMLCNGTGLCLPFVKHIYVYCLMCVGVLLVYVCAPHSCSTCRGQKRVPGLLGRALQMMLMLGIESGSSGRGASSLDH